MNDFISQIETHYSDNYRIDERITVRRKAYDLFQYNFGFLYKNRSYRAISDLCNRFKLTGKSILDIGSFTGYNSFYFACMNNNVTGIEISSKIEFAKKRYGKYHVRFEKGNIMDFLEPSFIGTYDFIYCSNLPIHYDKGSVIESNLAFEFFTKLSAGLKKEGVFYYIFYSTRHEKVTYPVTCLELEMLMKKNNITKFDIAERIIYDYPMVELIIRK